MGKRYEIDPIHSSVAFGIRHMMVATVRGRFGQFSGYVETEDGEPAGGQGELVVQAASIDTGTEQRDNHLRSADFFETEKYPEIRFRSTSIESAGGDRYRVLGDLTIRDVTRPVEFEGQVEGRISSDGWGNQRLAVSARGQFDRKDFGLTWNQPMQEVGGLMVGDTVKFEVELSLTHKTAEVAVG